MVASETLEPGLPTTRTIDARFNGPPTSANGGYAAGVAASELGGSATATLRRPPPLDTPMRAVRDGDRLSLLDADGVLVVEAEPATLELDVPEVVDLATATEAATRYPAFDAHIFPTCFVCGPARAPGDGLRIFSGPVDDPDGTWAAPWTPDPSLGHADGTVRDEVVWAALDCPGGFAAGRGELAAVLGRMTATLDHPVRAGEPHVSLSWPLGAEGRKLFAGSAIVTAEGRIAARARTTWIRFEGEWAPPS